MRDYWIRFKRDWLALGGLVVIVIFIVSAVLAPAIAPYSPSEQFFDGLTLEGSPLGPNSRFWFGTDTNGRDQFSRLLYGAQTSLLIGIVANGIAVFVGTCLGVVAGYLRGFVGSAIMRFTDLMMAFPPLLLAILEMDPQNKRPRIVLAGDPPNPENIPAGCPFHPRCQYAMAVCSQSLPALDTHRGRNVACHLY